MTNSTARVQYHQLLGSGMQLKLTAVQVFVTTESSILSESPRVDILLLRREGEAWNEAQRARLPARTNNAFVKLFASRKQERNAGFASLEKSVLAESTDMHAYVLGLRQTLNVKEGSTMAEVLTPEKVLEYGRRIRQLVFETGTPEERLAGLSPDEILAGLRTEERRKLLRLLQEEEAADNRNAARASEDTT